MVNGKKQLERIIELARQGELECCTSLRKSLVCQPRGEVLVQLADHRDCLSGTASILD
jgi:hypothetical protein